MLRKQEYPPLLPQGFHHRSIQQIRELCVEPFPLSHSRTEMMASFEVIFEHAQRLLLSGDFWLDGSFLTQKIDPDDIDFVLFVSAYFYSDGTKEQQDFLNWLIDSDNVPRKSFRCDTDLVLVYPQGHAEYQHYIETAAHWEKNVYGFSVTTQEPKGIVVVSLSGEKAV